MSEITFHSVIYNMPDAEYRAVEAVSQSTLKTIVRKTPAHYIHEVKNGRPDSPSLNFGRYFHDIMLLGSSDYIVRPAGLDGRTKEGKAWMEANQGRDTVTHEDGEKVKAMQAALKAHPDASLALASGMAEVSVFAEIDGIKCKGRFDWVPKAGNAIVDVKTCEDASDAGFAAAFSKFDYHIQAAFYLTLAEASGLTDRTSFVFVAIEKDAPHAVGVYEAAADAVEKGRNDYTRALATIRACRDLGEWPSYPTGLRTVNLLPYKYREGA